MSGGMGGGDPANEFSRYTIAYFLRKDDDKKEKKEKKVAKVRVQGASKKKGAVFLTWSREFWIKFDRLSDFW